MFPVTVMGASAMRVPPDDMITLSYVDAVSMVTVASETSKSNASASMLNRTSKIPANRISLYIA
jgi:hypothetical protein